MVTIANNVVKIPFKANNDWMENQDRVSELTRELANTDTPLPLLHKLLLLLNADDPVARELSKSALLSYFESLRKSFSLETVGRMVKSLRSEYQGGTLEAEFLDISQKAYDLLIEEEKKKSIQEVYKNLIRTFSFSYLFDGTIPKCPKCNSINVKEGENSFYEYRDMRCGDCGHMEIVDDYQLEDWYPL
ncbi:MAG: hypothetical protein K8R21_10280 [Leptospira sp.]|nr:hypothetical protein [Leptospira sp.]